MYQTAAICLLGALASASAYVATPSALPRAGAHRYASAMPPLFAERNPPRIPARGKPDNDQRA